MGKTKGLYNEEYPVGTIVRIAERNELENFRKTWKFHHPLKAKQLAFANKTGKVKEVSFYHGGDELYVLDEIPGTWHEQCLKKE